MANIFDKDTASTDNHLLNEQFHTFSKSPSSPGSTLGGASNRSGHTVSASDVWAEKIPAFFYPKADSDYAVCKANAKLNDICRWGDEIQIWDGEKFVKFADNYAAIPDGHEFLNEEGQPVVRFHKSRIAYNLNDTNNAYDNSLDASGKGASAKILGWDKTANNGAGAVYTYVESAPQFITQFVAPTDNIVKGVPSKGYGPIVMVGGSPLTEDADSTAGYIANNFAGIIQFNERKAQGAVTVHAFEYCGKTLGSAASDIAELEDKISKISVTASGGIQGVSEDATTAGLSTKWVKLVEGEEVDAQPNEEGAYPVLTIETCGDSSTEGSTTLITAGTAHTLATYYADLAVNTALDEGGSIAEYVAANAKVSVNGQSATTITVAGTSAGSNDLVKIAVDEDKTVTDKIGLTLTASVDTATVAEGVVKSGDESKLVTAGDAAKIAEKAADGVDVGVTGITINNRAKQTGDVTISVVTGVIGQAESVGELGSGGNPNGITLNLYDDNRAYVVVTPAEYDAVSKAFTSATSTYLTTASDVTAFVSAVSSDLIDIVASKTLDSSTSSTQGSYVSVTTSGTIGTGLTVNVNDGALASTVSAAASAIQGITLNGDTVNSNRWVTVGADRVANITLPKIAFDPAVDDSTSHGITIRDSVNGSGYGISNHYIGIAAAQYTPASGETAGSWAQGTANYFTTASTVESFVNATVGADLAALQSKVNAYHEAGVSYKVHNSQTLPDLSVAENVDTYKNVILLVPTSTHPDAGPDVDNTEAMSGGYIEYLCVKTGETTYAWEKIGTTEADLAGYVRFIYAEQDDTLPNFTPETSTVYAHISSDGYLSLGAVSATDTLMGVSKLFTGHYSKMASVVDRSNTAVSLDTVSYMFREQENHYAQKNEVVSSINGKSGAVNLCVHNYRGNDSREEGSSQTYPSASNHANLWGMSVFAANRDVILVDDFVGMSGSYIITANLPSDAASVENNFVYNASGNVITTIRPERMVSGFNASDAAGLTTFIGDLSNLEDSMSTFYKCSALTAFIGDLSSLRDGSGMFAGCSSLTTFIGDLSSLEKGGNNDKSSSGGMFVVTNLTVESVENIADTLPENPVVDIDVRKGTIGISWYQLTSDTEERQKLVDALSGVVDKGWVLYTNSELCTMFDTEKYQVVQQTVQPLDLDSETQEITYVIKK